MAEAPSLFLCVDCGGTKTAASIASKDGTIVGRGIGGPSNYTDVSLEKFVESFGEAVIAAYRQAIGAKDAVHLPLPEKALTAALVGVAGIDSQEGILTLTGALAPLLNLPPTAPHLVVANDTSLIASPLRLHHDISTAVVIIAGTGSIAVAFGADESGTLREQGRVGGWGFLLGDEGSGFFLGRETVREILTRADRATLAGEPVAPSLLRDRVFAEWEIVNDPYNIFSVIYGPEPDPAGPKPAKKILEKERKHRMASLAPHVFECAFKHDDELAWTVIRRSASIHAAQIASTLKTRNATDAPKHAVVAADSILCMGGTLVSKEPYQKVLMEELAKLGHVFRYMKYVDNVTDLGAAGIASSTP
ncbi:hypothetical protein BKA62DRAFT_702722 [Auriculariales sp. MPI-PUGE-AT-0066]|nr:hypothetical protein BKA62DRAFT_702722 [Auriculariales sp. MPI-PUGE-AT-0066]